MGCIHGTRIGIEEGGSESDEVYIQTKAVEAEAKEEDILRVDNKCSEKTEDQARLKVSDAARRTDSLSVYTVSNDDVEALIPPKSSKQKSELAESQSVIMMNSMNNHEGLVSSIYGIDTNPHFAYTEPAVSWDEGLVSNACSKKNVRSMSDKKILVDISKKRPMEALNLIKPNEVAAYNQLYEQSDDESDYYAVLDERTEEDFREAFQHVDADNDGRITFKEFCYALEYLEIRWDILEAQKVFAELDAETRLRTLDYTSFCHACHIIEPRLREIWKNIQRKACLEQGKARRKTLMDEGVTHRKAESASVELKKIDEEGNTKADVLREKVKDTKAYTWQVRLDAIKKITALGRDMAPEGFQEYFKHICSGFCLQIKDNKSVVVKETCLALADMYTEMQDKTKLHPFVEPLLSALLHSLCIRTKIISESAYQCSEHLIKCVPDDPETLPLLNTLTKNARSHEHPRAREACFTFLAEYVDLSKSLCKTEQLGSKLWVTIVESVEGGVSDVDSVRTAALNTLVTIGEVESKVQEDILSRFEPQMLERFHCVRNNGNVLSPKQVVARRVSSIQRRKRSLRKTVARLERQVTQAKDRVTEVCKNNDANDDDWLTRDEVEKVLTGLGYKTDISYRVGFLMEHLKKEERPEVSIADLVVYFGGLVEDNPDAIPRAENLSVPRSTPRTKHARKVSRGNRRKMQNIPKNIMFQGERVKTILQTRDKDGTGFFPVEELAGIWEEIGESNKDKEKCKRELVEDSRISINEFHDWWLYDEVTKHNVDSKFQKLLKQISEDDLKKAFKRCDSDNDGVMRIADFCMAMESLGLQWSLDEAKSAFKLIDVNHDKSIDYEAFKHGVYHINADNLEVFWTRLLTGEVEEEKKEVEEEYTKELILDLLKDIKGDWRKRVKSMQNLVILLKEMSDTEFQEEFNVWSERLTLQVKDRRSQVSRAATENIAKIIVHRKQAFHPFVTFLFPELMAVVRMTGVKVQSQSAHQLCKVLVINVSDTNEEHHTLNSIIDQYENGVHKLLKKACFEYLTIILDQISKSERNVPRTEEYLNKIQKMLSKGIQDSDAGTRNQAFRGLAFLSFIDESRANQVMQVMSTRPAVMKKYTRIKKTIEEKETSLKK